MNSPFAVIYQAIQARITAQVPALANFIDLDYGQLEARERPAVTFPGVLIDFPEWDFSDLSNLAQEGDGYITIKLFTNPYSSSEAHTPTTFLQDAISILDLEYDLNIALHGWSPADGIAPMGRVKAGSDNRRPGMKVRILRYSCNFQDYSAQRTRTLIPGSSAPPDIEMDL